MTTSQALVGLTCVRRRVIDIFRKVTYDIFVEESKRSTSMDSYQRFTQVNGTGTATKHTSPDVNRLSRVLVL